MRSAIQADFSRFPLKGLEVKNEGQLKCILGTIDSGFRVGPYLFDMTVTYMTGFQRDLLVVIAGLNEPHGIAIKEELEEFYETEIHHGRLYPNLDELVDADLVEKGAVDKRTNRYTITDQGWRVLAEHRAWEDQHIDDVRSG